MIFVSDIRIKDGQLQKKVCMEGVESDWIDVPDEPPPPPKMAVDGVMQDY